MNGFLLDTNCISELIRVAPNHRVIGWFESVDERLLFLSVLTLGEIRKGIALLPKARRRTQLESWLEISLKSRFADRILPVDEFICDRWGSLMAQAKEEGRGVGVIDGLLAATAQHHNLTVATRNVADFMPLRVPVFDPWKP